MRERARRIDALLLAFAIICLVAGGVLGARVAGGRVTRGVTLAMGPTMAVTASVTPSVSMPMAPVPTATHTATASATMMSYVIATATSSPTPTVTVSVTPALTDTPEPTATATPTMTATPYPQPTPDGVARSLRVPILMYHYVSVPPAGADAVRVDLSVAPDRFEEHLQYLQQAGYRSVTLSDLMLALQTGHSLPDKPIVITFDDGYRDNYEYAFPLLRKYGFVGTFFLLTKPIDDGDPGYVSWEQVVEMDAAGMEIGSHGYTHISLAGKTTDYIIWQTLGSKEAIEERIGKPVRFFCYPSGGYDDETIRVLHSVGYWGGVAVTWGGIEQSGSPFEMPRVRIRGRYDAKALASLLNWLATQD